MVNKQTQTVAIINDCHCCALDNQRTFLIYLFIMHTNVNQINICSVGNKSVSGSCTEQHENDSFIQISNVSMSVKLFEYFMGYNNRIAIVMAHIETIVLYECV